ncbi:chemotaxis protein CheW [Thiohalobacter sp. IOR34]|uniref:chemotaxis protein CheW n=1 Tax=Thiohalobacter sp. IOR34 TaxID=3057176 RepID=UPI0025AF52F5|nr:chemotaxis protein CheW [Thiohalobacter sp. IOR34]WJW75793.1 chemotaxis protein CheW [Thiohalobacter sp. IOR34]
MSAETTDPLALLRDLERRCRSHARPLPSQVEIREDWLGIGFRVGDSRLVAPLDEVAEILTYPGFSKVPGSKEWVRGIANVRGNLLPIMDLNGYLHGRPALPGRKTRVLVINHRGVFSGLVVDEVLGLKHFLPEQRIDEVEGVDDTLQPYLSHGFHNESGLWGVFSMRRLAETPQFLQAAV